MTIAMQTTPAPAVTPIEGYRSDPTGDSCATAPAPGARALARELAARFGGRAEILACRPVRGGTRMSLHGEGRAVDWFRSANDPAQAAEAQRIVDWLLAPDAAGHAHALARRMGVQEIIWNRRIWTARRHGEGLRPYTGANPHTDHVHIGLNREGAAMRTSHWRALPAPPVAQQAGLPEDIAGVADPTGAGKGRIFDLLRQAGRSGPVTDPAVARAVARAFPAGTEDLWLAERLLRHGAEPLWPAAEIDARAARGWPAERGYIRGDLRDPVSPGEPRHGGRTIQPVVAYFFPGTQAGARALVVGGIHGNEPAGAWVVQKLCEALMGRRPRWSTLLIPVLNVVTHDTGVPPTHARRYAMKHRYLPRMVNGRMVPNAVEPNRTFPLPGMSYATARARGASGPELVMRSGGSQIPVPDSGFTMSTMPPETRVLVTLLERFQPTRIATCHGHSVPGTGGDGPGMFVDPRGVDPATSRVVDAAARRQDLEFTTRLRDHARAACPPALADSAFRGNRGAPEGVLYTSTNHPAGNSLGMYGPVEVRDAHNALVRPAATTVTVEVPKYTTGGGRNDPPDSARIDAVVPAFVDALLKVFLETP